jgi:FAD:protein FMN transferase
MATATAPERALVTHEAKFRAMGTDVHLLVVGGSVVLLEHAQRRLEELEARWSRFRPTSELCRLNAADGRPVVVSDDTFALIERACDASKRTAGAFDPTVLPALERAGYDRDFDAIDPDDPREPTAGEPAPGCDGIALDPIVRAVRLPPGVRLDLGGIGKGFAADIVAEELLDAGAAGVCVNLGGDLRVAGESPSGDAWVVEVEIPVDRGEHADPPPLLALAEGAIATTSRCGRVWRRGTKLQHHVIDPRSGLPAVTPWVSATVVAARAVDAEPLAKAALLAGSVADAGAVLGDHTACGLLVDTNGVIHPAGGVDAFVVDRAGDRSANPSITR